MPLIAYSKSTRLLIVSQREPEPDWLNTEGCAAFHCSTIRFDPMASCMRFRDEILCGGAFLAFPRPFPGRFSLPRQPLPAGDLLGSESPLARFFTAGVRHAEKPVKRMTRQNVFRNGPGCRLEGTSKFLRHSLILHSHIRENRSRSQEQNPDSLTSLGITRFNEP